jgi:hypothetical protein
MRLTREVLSVMPSAAKRVTLCECSSQLSNIAKGELWKLLPTETGKVFEACREMVAQLERGIPIAPPSEQHSSPFLKQFCARLLLLPKHMPCNCASRFRRPLERRSHAQQVATWGNRKL